MSGVRCQENSEQIVGLAFPTPADLTVYFMPSRQFAKQRQFEALALPCLQRSEQSTGTTWPAKPEFQTGEKPWRQRHSKARRASDGQNEKHSPEQNALPGMKANKAVAAKCRQETKSRQPGAKEDTQPPRPPVPREESASSTMRSPDRMPRSRASRFHNADTSPNACRSADSLGRSRECSPDYFLD